MVINTLAGFYATLVSYFSQREMEFKGKELDAGSGNMSINRICYGV